MARGDEENKSPEELEFEKNSSERAKISLPEAVIVLTATAMADLMELIPFGFIFGMFISAGITLWFVLRGMYTARRRLAKLLLLIGGPALDFFTLGLFPEVLTLAALILIHNQGEAKNVKAILSAMGKKRSVRIK